VNPLRGNANPRQPLPLLISQSDDGISAAVEVGHAVREEVALLCFVILAAWVAARHQDKPGS
jgi:hypothetical protein